jgi:cyclic pyranopterin monophosphate synthase
MAKLSHYDSAGRARMVDVSAKSATRREAEASAFVKMEPAVLQALPKNSKGDPFEVARIAGIMAAKRTSDLIPMCHPLPLSHVDVDLRLCENGLAITSKVATTANTGVEMEALVAACVCALTLYDMTKGLDKGIAIREIVLQRKSGGKSGNYQREEATGKRAIEKTRKEPKTESAGRNGGSHSEKKQPAR